MGDGQIHIDRSKLNYCPCADKVKTGKIVVTKKIGRDAETGRFIPVAQAQKSRKLRLLKQSKSRLRHHQRRNNSGMRITSIRQFCCNFATLGNMNADQTPHRVKFWTVR
jgi:hypothetical protein